MQVRLRDKDQDKNEAGDDKTEFDIVYELSFRLFDKSQ